MEVNRYSGSVSGGLGTAEGVSRGNVRKASWLRNVFRFRVGSKVATDTVATNGKLGEIPHTRMAYRNVSTPGNKSSFFQKIRDFFELLRGRRKAAAGTEGMGQGVASRSEEGTGVRDPQAGRWGVVRTGLHQPAERGRQWSTGKSWTLGGKDWEGASFSEKKDRVRVIYTNNHKGEDLGEEELIRAKGAYQRCSQNSNQTKRIPSSDYYLAGRAVELEHILESREVVGVASSYNASSSSARAMQLYKKIGLHDGTSIYASARYRLGCCQIQQCLGRTKTTSAVQRDRMGWAVSYFEEAANHGHSDAISMMEALYHGDVIQY